MFYSHLVRQICLHMLYMHVKSYVHVHVHVWLMAHPVGMNMCAHEYLMLESVWAGCGFGSGLRVYRAE